MGRNYGARRIEGKKKVHCLSGLAWLRIQRCRIVVRKRNDCVVVVVAGAGGE